MITVQQIERVREWTDGVALVRQDGRRVTVQVLGDVWATTYGDAQAAELAYLGEIETERSRAGLPATALAYLVECEP